MTLVPFVKTDPAPLVSQLPETAHVPDVNVIVPLVPPVIVTFVTVTVAWLPLTTPPVLTVRLLEPKVKKPEFPAVSVSVSVTETAQPAVPVILTVLVVPLIVTVEVALLKVPPLESQLLGAVNEGDPDIVNVPPLLTRTSPAVPVDVVDPTERSVPVIVRPPESVSVV